MGITEEQYKQLLNNKMGVSQPKKKHKYFAEATYVDDIKFQSKLESQYYQTLLVRQQKGDLLYFLRQVPIRLPGSTTFWCDFMVVEKDGTIRWIDTKGRETQSFRTKKRQVEALYPIRIELIKR